MPCANGEPTTWTGWMFNRCVVKLGRSKYAYLFIIEYTQILQFEIPQKI